MYTLDNLPNQLPGEKPISLMRRHWFTLFVSVVLFVFMGITLPFFFFVITPSPFDSRDARYAFTVMILGLYYLSLLTFLFHEFLDFYLDVWIITTERIIAIEQKGLFSRVISEQNLTRVQDVTSEIHGIFPTMLNYGNVYIQTAGEVQRFNFKNVPHPVEVAKLLNDEVNDCKLRHHEEIEKE